MTVRVRFAPSPTGRLHVGNARIALVNWLLARAKGGDFVLRMDDTDAERCRPEFVAAIEEDLRWLGLEWRQQVFQSRRLDLYREAAERLKAAGRLYPCYETPEELDYKRRRQRARGKPPVYDREALRLSDEDRRRLEAEGRRPHWRFRLDEAEDVRWRDLVRGESHIRAGSISDPVVIRGDGTFLYMLPSAVDDIDLGVTHVVRGEDHVTNTAAQIQMIRALGGEPPAFAHLPLMVGAKGEGLSKRLGSLSLAELRQDGIEPLALNSLLAKLGSADPVEPRLSLAELAAEFDIARLGRSSPRFDRRELEHLNARLLHGMPFAQAAPRLRALGLEGVDEAFWDAVRPNLARLDEVAEWWAVCRAPLTPAIAKEDRDWLRQAADLLPPEPWGEDTWAAFISAVKDVTGRKGKALFRPLRLALTGREHGPELKVLLPLVGRERARARLLGETA